MPDSYTVTVTMTAEELRIVRTALLIHKVDDQLSLRRVSNPNARAELEASLATTTSLLDRLVDATAKAEAKRECAA